MRARAFIAVVMVVLAVAMLGTLARTDAAMWVRTLGDAVDCSKEGACSEDVPAVWCCEGGDLKKCFVGVIPSTTGVTFQDAGACLDKRGDMLVEGVMDYRDSAGHGYGKDARLGLCPEGYERIDASMLPRK